LSPTLLNTTFGYVVDAMFPVAQCGGKDDLAKIAANEVVTGVKVAPVNRVLSPGINKPCVGIHCQSTFESSKRVGVRGFENGPPAISRVQHTAKELAFIDGLSNCSKDGNGIKYTKLFFDNYMFVLKYRDQPHTQVGGALVSSSDDLVKNLSEDEVLLRDLFASNKESFHERFSVSLGAFAFLADQFYNGGASGKTKFLGPGASTIALENASQSGDKFIIPSSAASHVSNTPDVPLKCGVETVNIKLGGKSSSFGDLRRQVNPNTSKNTTYGLFGTAKSNLSGFIMDGAKSISTLKLAGTPPKMQYLAFRLEDLTQLNESHIKQLTAHHKNLVNEFGGPLNVQKFVDAQASAAITSQGFIKTPNYETDVMIRGLVLTPRSS
jgi:hypothetical protein